MEIRIWLRMYWLYLASPRERAFTTATDSFTQEPKRATLSKKIKFLEFWRGSRGFSFFFHLSVIKLHGVEVISYQLYWPHMGQHPLPFLRQAMRLKPGASLVLGSVGMATAATPETVAMRPRTT